MKNDEITFSIDEKDLPTIKEVIYHARDNAVSSKGNNKYFPFLIFKFYTITDGIEREL